MSRCEVTKLYFWQIIERKLDRAIRRLSTPAKWALTYVYPARPGLGSHVENVITDDGPIDHAQQFGVASIPPPGERMVMITVPIGNSAEHNTVVGEIDHTGARPADLSIGDVCLYSRPGARIWLKDGGDILIHTDDGRSIELAKNGNITVNSNGANINLDCGGGEVNLGATGGAAVGRVGDGVAPTAAFTSFLLALSTATGVPVFSGGDVGTISSGATKVKAV